jgi:hypothetical protein
MSPTAVSRSLRLVGLCRATGSSGEAGCGVRVEYYEELRATDKQTAAADGHSDRPPLDSVHVAPERAKHILEGDRWGGGHRHGTGRPGKTEFPSGWDDEKIIGHILGVACVPDDPPVFQAKQADTRRSASAGGTS